MLIEHSLQFLKITSCRMDQLEFLKFYNPILEEKKSLNQIDMISCIEVLRLFTDKNAFVCIMQLQIKLHIS